MSCITCKLIFPFMYVQAKLQKSTHVATNSSSSKNIKYLRCTWHSADFMTTSILKVNGAENIFIYAGWQNLETSLAQPINTSGLETCHLCSEWKYQNPASHYSGSAVGQATWQSSHATCRIWGVRSSFLAPLLTTDWGNVLTQSLCTSKQNYNVPTVEKCRRLGIE